jgi:hypothetical protein
MIPDEIAQVCDDLHECIDQPSGETPLPVVDTTDWYKPDRLSSRTLRNGNMLREHPQIVLRDASRAL